MKSERLKKLETELGDLEQWMQLGLVPKKDIEKHQDEIRSLKERIQEEKVRLRYLKETGDLEEYVTPKRSNARPVYTDPHTLPDMDINDHMTEGGFDMETETYEMETLSEDETESGKRTDHEATIVEDEDPFSDRNRWRRGVLEDPDMDSW